MSKPYKHQSPPDFWKKLARQLAVLIVAIALVFLAADKGYGVWRKSALLREARAHFAKDDYASALLTTRRVIELQPDHREANQLAADITDKAGHPDSVDWRARVCELNPGDVNAALAWARTAVKFGKFPTAQKALDSVAPEARARADYQQLEGGVMVGLGRPREAGKFYDEALRLEPGNDQNRFNRANWILQLDPDAEHKKSAEADLTKLTESPKYAAYAHRALLNFAADTRRWDTALVHSSVLTKGKEVAPADWALHLESLAALKSTELESELSRAQTASASQPLLVVAILEWMNQHGRAEGAIAWAASLQPEIAADPNVALSLAGCLDTAKQWPQLRDHVRGAKWKDKDALRLAYAARAYRELGNGGSSNDSWNVALSEARTPEKANQLLVRLTQWGWKREAGELLWKMADGPHGSWALGALSRSYQADLDTKGMLRVATALVAREPANEAARNNVAALSLLLDQDTTNATALAAELFKQHPRSIGIASTHALALWKQGKGDEALQVLETFKTAELRHPAIASTYGLLLAWAKRPEAREILQIAEKASLLPEERQLVKKALGELAVPQ